jgi:thiol-disulfide isomerase/thioredoxin
MTTENSPTPAPSSPRTALLAAALAALAGFGAVYVTLRPADNAERDPVVKTAAAVSGGSGLASGEMAKFVFAKTPELVPPISFLDGTGKARTFADWKGKVVLLNLWATWCGPCRKEMPSLDKLQAELGSDKFEVVALSVDRTGLEGAKKFLDSIKVSKLALYADPTAKHAIELKAPGLPATLLIDGQGREIGRLIGPAEWDSEDAKKLIRAQVQ